MLPSTARLRRATPADRESIVEVVNAHAASVTGTPRVLVDSRGDLRFARYIPASAEQIVAELHGRVVGFAALASRQPHIVAELTLAADPEHHRQSLGAQLIGWAEAQARKLAHLAPRGAQVVLQCHLFESDRSTIELVERRGFELVREWLHFEIDMSAPPPVPVWPDGVAAGPMDQRRDWPAVGQALDQAFADHWGELRRDALPPEDGEAEDDNGEDAPDEGDDPYSNSRDHCFVIARGDEVIGSCLGNARTVEWPATGKIGSISVTRQHRRRGIGLAMMYHALGAFYRRGIRRVVLDTDAGSWTGSYRVYERAGMHVFRRERLYEKVARPGAELRALSPEQVS